MLIGDDALNGVADGVVSGGDELVAGVDVGCGLASLKRAQVRMCVRPSLVLVLSHRSSAAIANTTATNAIRIRVRGLWGNFIALGSELSSLKSQRL
jgi:hypothetical protein